MALDPKLQKFTTASQAIISYDYTDIAEGIGIIVFNGFVSKETTNLSYHLARQTPTSNDIVVITSIGSDSGAIAQISDLDYDTSPFNLPQRIKGTARVIITIGFGQNVVSDGGDGYIIVKLRKWDGSSETEIGSAQSETVNLDTGAATVKSKTLNVSIPITTQVNFEQGDALRCTIEFWRGQGTDGTGNYGYGVDPADRNDDGYSTGQNDAIPVIEDDQTTKFEVHIPFVLDL